MVSDSWAGFDRKVERVSVQKGVADTRSKMRPGMMTMEMAMTEQEQYLWHHESSESSWRLQTASLTPVMPD